MKKYSKIIISAAVILIFTAVIIAIIIYTAPIKINKEFTAYYYGVRPEYENKTISCVLEIEYKRYLFKNSEVHGSIFIDGAEYYSNTGYTRKDGRKDKFTHSKGFWEELKLKLSGDYIISFFYLAENVEEKGKFLASTEDFFLFDFDPTFEYFTIVLKSTDPENSYMDNFYGPAETEEEAISAMHKIYPE